MTIPMRSFGLAAVLALAGCTTPKPAQLGVEPAGGTSTATDDPTARIENCKSKLHEALDSRIRADEASLAKLEARRDELSKLASDEESKLHSAEARGIAPDRAVYEGILKALETIRMEIPAMEADLAALPQKELQFCAEQVRKDSPTQA